MDVFSVGIFIVFFNTSSQFTDVSNRGDIMVGFIEHTFNINTQLKYVFIIKNRHIDTLIYITFKH